MDPSGCLLAKYDLRNQLVLNLAEPHSPMPAAGPVHDRPLKRTYAQMGRGRLSVFITPHHLHPCMGRCGGCPCSERASAPNDSIRTVAAPGLSYEARNNAAPIPEAFLQMQVQVGHDEEKVPLARMLDGKGWERGVGGFDRGGRPYRD